MLPQCASCPISCVESSTRATRARSVQSTSSFLSCCAAALTSSTCSRSVYQHVWHLVCLVDSRTRARALAVPLSWCASLTSTAALSYFVSPTSTATLYALPLSPTLSHTCALLLPCWLCKNRHKLRSDNNKQTIYSVTLSLQSPSTSLLHSAVAHRGANTKRTAHNKTKAQARKLSVSLRNKTTREYEIGKKERKEIKQIEK